MPQPPLIVVMGVSGSGKSTVGERLAAQLDVAFIDADGLHPITNVDKMSKGIPLTDEDRWPWLAKVGEAMHARLDTGVVVACSALRRSYRDAIRAEAPGTKFVHLTGSRELLASRLKQREDHFMPPTLLDSQLATLEPLAPDEGGFTIDVGDDPDALVAAIAVSVSQRTV